MSIASTVGPIRRLAVFDCDGTLSDGQAAVCVAMERAFASTGHMPPQRDAIRRIVGLSLPQAVAVLAPGAPGKDRQAIVDGYREAFRTARYEGAVSEPLFDGIAAALSELTDRGWLLGVATGKSDRGLSHTLAQHRIADRFVTLQTADRHPSKPHPAMLLAAMDQAEVEPGDTVMIGDTVFDIEMAQVARTRAIGVGWGYHQPQELRAAGAQAVAATPAELVALLA